MTLFSSFGKQKPKTPQELVNKTASALQHLNSAIRDKELEKASEEATKYISALKHSLMGSDDEHPDKAVVNATVEAMVTCDVLFLMVERLQKLDFETRKDVASIYSFICKHKGENDVVLGLEYLRTHHIIIELLFRGYDEASIALNCGSMLRDCFKDELIAKRVLESSILQAFFDKVQVSSFELASDAFMSFKFLLTRHPGAVAEFLLIHYEMFFSHYNALLKSENYMTRRQSLKLLGELLMGRNNVRIMVQYVSNVANLMLVMNLLKDASRTIQFEAFHVFKVFVANPRKPKKVVEILVSNKEKLLRYLSKFLEEKEVEDEDFKNEKADIMREIEELEREEGAPAISPSPSRPLDQFSAYGVSRPLEGVSTTLEGFSRPLEGMSRPLEGMSRPLDSISRPLEGVSRPLDGSSRALEDLPHHMHGAVSSRGQADV